jgi:glutamate racemase
MRNDDVNLPIGFMDSGLGGLSVLIEAVHEMPSEDYLYYGDSANAPYGEKTRDQVLRRSRDIVDFLLNKGAKAIVIACNTATSAAAPTLRNDYAHVPIIGVEPALKPATLVDENKRILVMATPITLRLDKYQQLAEKWGTGREVIDAPCPGLAARIERGHLEDHDVVSLLEQLVGGYRGEVDAVVLGCTHYSFVAQQILQVLGDVRLYDGALGTARQLERKLAERGLLTKSSGAGVVKFLSSKDTPEEIELYQSFYSM